MARVDLTTPINLLNIPALLLEDVHGINRDSPTVVTVVIAARSTVATGRQLYKEFSLGVRDGVINTVMMGEPPAPVAVPDLATSSTKLVRGPAGFYEGLQTTQAVIPNALTNLITAWFGAGNAAGQNPNQRREARKQAALTQLLADGIIDATLAGNVL